MAQVAHSLVDTSALSRYRHGSVGAVLEPLLDDGHLATCGIVDLEVLYSARSPADYAALSVTRRLAFEWLPTEDVDLRRALDIQARLATTSRHRIAFPDLIIAAVAERHRVTVLHYDADYDLIAEITRQPAEWVVPGGTVP